MRLLGRLLLAVCFLTLSACALFAPGPPPLHGGGLLRGEAAEQLAVAAGVQGAEIPPGFVGNLVWIDTTHALTVRHFLDADLPHVDFLGFGAEVLHSDAIRFEARGAEDSSKTWSLVRRLTRSHVAPSSLQLGGPTEPGQDTIIVGHSPWLGVDDEAAIVGMRGRLLPMPPGLDDELAGLLVIDLGPEPRRSAGLSGSPVLTRSSPEEPWRWVGLMEGAIHSSRGDRAGIAVPIPEELVRSLRAASAP